MSIDISDGIEEGNLRLKVLSTNTTSLTLLTDEKFNGKVMQPERDAVKLSGEHGLAMSIEVLEGDTTHLFLFDTGGPLSTAIKNSKQLKINLHEVEKLVLSHGHIDHYGGLMKVIPELKEGCEFYLSPKAFTSNQIVITKTGEEISATELGTSLRTLNKEGKLKINWTSPGLNKDLISNLVNSHNIKMIETTQPVKVSRGITTSGEIELFDKTEVTKGFYLAKTRKEYEKNYFRDEISIYINIKNKGLVVLTGCGHCGIINTIKHGQKLTGIDKVYAVIGGFHEEWNSDEIVDKKVKFLEDLNPEIICGMHCTGFNFNAKMAKHKAHTLGIVGTEFHL
jgi:7,8-dihydropterin-6-yl-methyl-4-(beta-D-ribofuranosyl)aminobenzene 5'-phosphate synthase